MPAGGKCTGTYWDRACDLIHGSGYVGSEGSYLIHDRRKEIARVGIICRTRVAVGKRSYRYTDATSGEPVAIDLPDAGHILHRIEAALDPDAPYFFILSPDVVRRHADESLPQALFVQPALELTFSPDAADGWVSHAQNAALERRGADMLRNLPANSSPFPEVYARNEPLFFPDIAARWVPGEDDDSFSHRIDEAVTALAEHPDGKMTLTRSYRHPPAEGLEPFELYELHAHMNGEYAFSHFFCLGDHVVSFGCTPENVFEIAGRRLTVDVVAGTCRSGDGEDQWRRGLLGAPKQVREHQSSLRPRMGRYSSFCEEGSIAVASEMDVIRLRHVGHLHSVITGSLRPGVTVFDFLVDVFPLLGARPRELLPIADSEAAPHRYYGGIVGYGSGDSVGCFLNLRNGLLTSDAIHAKVGVGIIGESTAGDELLEGRMKISGLMEAVHLWKGGASRRAGQRGAE